MAQLMKKHIACVNSIGCLADLGKLAHDLQIQNQPFRHLSTALLNEVHCPSACWEARFSANI